MNQPDILLFDANSLGYSAQYQPNLAKLQHNGMSTAALHGTMLSLFSRMAEYPTAVPVVLWDGHAGWRKELLPEYKSNRSATPEKVEIRKAYRQQVPYIQLMLMALGIPQIRAVDAEADDLAGLICRGLPSSVFIEMVTKDTDWWQALAETAHWYSPLNKTLLTLAAFTNPEEGTSEGHFVSTEEYIWCKALAGDKSDDIPGVDKVGLKTAAKFIRQFGTIEALWEQADAGTVKVKGAIMEKLILPATREMYAKNLLLIDWRNAPALNTKELAATFMEPDFAEFEQIAENFGLSRVVMMAKKANRPTEAWTPRWHEVLNALGA